MNPLGMVRELLEASKGLSEAVCFLAFGWVTLDPPELMSEEEKLGELNPLESSLLTFKKSLAMTDSKLLHFGAVVVTEIATFFMRLRLSLDSSKIGIRKSGDQLVIVKINPTFEEIGLVAMALFSGSNFLLESPTVICSKKKIPIIDPYALLPSEDGDEFFVSGCPYKWALFCNTCSYRFVCHISLPKRELVSEEAFA
jgi:hypothetical protein